MASGDRLALFTPYHDTPPASLYATLDSVGYAHVALSFDPSSAEVAIFPDVMPPNYTSGANINVRPYFAAATAVTGTIGWLAAFERVSSGQQLMSVSGFGSDSTISAATVPASAGLVINATATVSAGALTDNVAPGEYYRVRLTRDVANDDAAGDAQLVALELREA